MKIKLIAEIGINHKGSYKIAKKLIDSAIDSGCWGIKFQYRNIQRFYNSTNEIGDEMISDEIKKSYLSSRDIYSLKDYAKKHNLKVGISFFNQEDLKDVCKKKNIFDFIKIPSAELKNYELVSSANKYSDIVILSTGGHNLKEIKNAVSLYSFLTNPIYLLCTSNYPSEIGSQNLATIDNLKKIKNIRIGYSSHDKDYEIPLIAAVLGAEFIERHVTLNKDDKGLDHSSSSDPSELKSLGKILNNLDRIYGNKTKPVNQGEKINMQNLGTSLYAKKNIKEGEKLLLKDVVVKAPKKGMNVEEFNKLNNKILKKSLLKNEAITESHFKNNRILSKEIKNQLIKRNISLPVRFHDLEAINNEFKLANYEIHMSYKDVSQMKNNLSKINNISDAFFTIHLPDYLDKDALFDPFSKKNTIKSKSLNMVEKIIKFEKKIINSEKKLISSIGVNSYKNKDLFYKNLKIFISQIDKKHSVKFLPQWLPKKAWYFGGSFDTEVFSSEEDIFYLKKYKIKICLDVAHLIMSANSSGEDWKEWYSKLKPLIEHIHISDASGEDGEGIEFGKGQLEHVDKIIKLDTTKVLEVWQGHLNNYEGFHKGLNFLGGIY